MTELMNRPDSEQTVGLQFNHEMIARVHADGKVTLDPILYIGSPVSLGFPYSDQETQFCSLKVGSTLVFDVYEERRKTGV